LTRPGHDLGGVASLEANSPRLRPSAGLWIGAVAGDGWANRQRFHFEAASSSRGDCERVREVRIGHVENCGPHPGSRIGRRRLNQLLDRACRGKWDFRLGDHPRSEHLDWPRVSGRPSS